MPEQSRPQPVLDEFLSKMPPNVTATFTAKQLSAMENALENRQWRQHPVDLRLSLPLFWKQFYVVLVAGEERRSGDRLRKSQTLHPIWTPGNILVLTTTVVTGLLALSAIVLLLRADLQTILRPGRYPADIPFKPDQASCEESGRVWQNDTCIDYEHDPSF
jgi:hypothetical protein